MKSNDHIKRFVTVNEQYISDIAEKEICKEVREALHLLRGVDVPLIAFFGSARIDKSSELVKRAEEVAFKLGEGGFGTITGGGPGIMRGANTGATRAGTTSVAMRAKMIPGEKINDNIFTHDSSFKWMFVRRFAMSIRSHALVFFPGGIGTLDEIFEYTMLMQNGVIEKAPIILADREFYKPLLKLLKDKVLSDGFMSESDFDLYHIEDDTDKIVDIIKKYTKQYGKINVNSFVQQNDLSRAVLQYNRDLGKHNIKFDGIDFKVYDQVFSPKIFNGWSVFTPRLAEEQMDGLDMLEIGSGTGITGLYLCKTKNLNSILLGDINHHAVSNTLENIELLDLKDKASVIESNVFDNVPKDKKFDIVYWNYPWLPEHKGYEYVDEVERGLFDPDYMYLKKYIKGARAFLKEKGRVFLGFGDFGDLDYLTHLAKREGYILKKMVSKVGDEGGDVKFILFELIPEESA